MSNTKVKAIGAKPTQEQLEEQAKRAFIQKRNAIAEMVLANAFKIEAPVRTNTNGTPGTCAPSWTRPWMPQTTLCRRFTR